MVDPSFDKKTPDRPLFCRECRFWYGAEDDEYGPCNIKHARNDASYLTHGGGVCNEGMTLHKDGR